VEGTEGRECCRGGTVDVLLRGRRRPEDAAAATEGCGKAVF
jgi:hypothetical protein